MASKKCAPKIVFGKEVMKMFEKSERVNLGYVYDFESGKKKQIKKTIKVVGRSECEVEALFQREKELLIYAYRSNTVKIERFGELVRYYYEINNGLKPKTLTTDLYLWNIAKVNFENKKVKDITPDFLMEYFKFVERKYSRTTVHDIYIMLNKFLNFAYDEDFILKNPLKRLKRSKYAKRPVVFQNISFKYFDVINKFFWLAFNEGDAFSVKLKVMLLLSADGCLREAELFGLKRERINLDEGYIEVFENMYRLTKKQSECLSLPIVGFTDVKTNSSIRKMPLSKITIEYLRRYFAECDAYLKKYNLINPNGFLFFQRRNIPDRYANFGRRKENAPIFPVRPAHISQYNTNIRRLCIKYGLEIFTSHKIRKWAFTLRYNSECTEQYCKYILGHSINKCDATYLLGMYMSAKRQHHKWESILNSVIKCGNPDIRQF